MPLFSDMHGGEFGARERASQPSSRSVSQKDSFKDIIAEIRGLQNPSSVLPGPPALSANLLDAPPHVPAFHLEDLDITMPRPLSLSGSSDQRGNKSFSSDFSALSQPNSVSTVTSHDYENVVMLKQESGISFVLAGEDPSLLEAEEVFVPPVSFTDGQALRDIPAETQHLTSQTETEQAITELPDESQVHNSNDLQVQNLLIQWSIILFWGKKFI